MATQIEELIIAIKAVGVDKVDAELRKLRKAGSGAGKSVENAGKQAEVAGKRFNRFRGPTSALTTTTGQLSVQFQDIAVQAQQGTDALRIFAQQGPQIASVFGPSGAVAGAIIAFGALLAGPLIASLFNTSSAIQDAIDKAREFEGELSSLTEAGRALQLTIVTEKMRETSTELRRLKDETDDVNARFNLFKNGTVNLSTVLDQITSGFLDFEESQRDSTQQVLANADAIQKAEERYAELSEQADILTGKTDEVTQEVKNQRENLESYLISLEEQFATLGMNAVQLGVYKAMQEGATVSEIRAVRAILEKIEAYKAEQQAAKESADAKKREDEEEKRREDARARRAESFIKRINKIRFQAIVDAREEQIKAEEEAAKQEEERQKERNERIFAEQKRHMERVFAEHKAQEERRKEMQATVNNALLSIEDKLLKGKSEKQKAAYRIGVNLMNEEKRANAAKIISDSYGAAMAAYKSLAGIPFVGPALGAAAAGVIIAAGASYATQSLAGRALGGQVRGGESYVVGERGPEVLTMGSNGRITPNEKLSAPSETNNQNVSVSFNITATDASGFDQLLQQRRGMIIGMINQAMNNRGRKALV